MKKVILILAAVLTCYAAFAEGNNVKNALIVYGSFDGSTKEVAEAVKKELEMLKIKTDIAPASDASSPAGYGMVILGSAIHGAAPHPDVISYVQKNLTDLNSVKTSVFIVCATITSENKKIREKAQKYPEKVAVGFKPFSTAVFGGMVGEPSGGFERFMAKMMLGIEKFGDFRDWESIKMWAKSLVN